MGSKGSLLEGPARQETVSVAPEFALGLCTLKQRWRSHTPLAHSHTPLLTTPPSPLIAALSTMLNVVLTGSMYSEFTR